MTFFPEKNSIFTAKISDDLFLVIDQISRSFPFFSKIFRIFTMLNVVYDLFLARKTPFLLCSYFRAHPTNYFSKYLGAPSLPRSPPLCTTTHPPSSPTAAVALRCLPGFTFPDFDLSPKRNEK